VIVTTNGIVADNPALLHTIKTLLPIGSADLQLLNDMATLGFDWRAYFFVPPGVRQVFDNTVLVPFRLACADRYQVPYHPLTTLSTAVHLEMDRIDQFR
jgi:hypothetical protein